ncbi:hypothetical protein [Mameliella alba]|uniref:Uncharacterized protein n=1 Tax=Mameliella alba TaxID=561184 RepID=A0A0B3SIH3_9RHOB|nr:hypothetical protein [Mameliella alba]KHQ50369.1 hypothetical protein OA50_05044 [Mameliella alba]
MSEWGPWIEHDGCGFPLAYAGQYMQATFILACEDEWGGAAGDERHQEFVAGKDVVNNPMWDHAKFGHGYHYISGPFAGRNFFAGKVIRYRIRKPRGVTLLQQIARDAKCPQKVDA